MAPRNSVGLRCGTIVLFLLMSVAASYAQPKSAATSITVYQDPG
jgi:hypothetical protein